MPNITIGTSVNLTETGTVSTQDCALIGFYVNSTAGGTLQLRKGGASGTVLGGQIMPSSGFHHYPASCVGSLHATIGNNLDVTFFFQEGMS